MERVKWKELNGERVCYDSEAYTNLVLVHTQASVHDRNKRKKEFSPNVSSAFWRGGCSSVYEVINLSPSIFPEPPGV